MAESAAPIPRPIHSRFLGVRLPRSVPFFDCRQSDEDLFRPDPDGRRRSGSERAALALGDPDYRVIVGVRGLQINHDARDPARLDETRSVLQYLRRQLAETWRAYRRALRNPASPEEGGGVAYPPVAVALCNYGTSVLVDFRRPAVERLG
jgi:hypothetical protein